MARPWSSSFPAQGKGFVHPWRSLENVVDNLVKDSNVFSNEFRARWSSLASEYRLGEGQEGKLTAFPAMDIKVKDEEIVLHAELPGVKKEDIELNVVPEKGYAELKGKKHSTVEQKEGDKVVSTERQFGEFQRRFPIPNNVKLDQISAKFTDGVLEVRIPTPKQEDKTKKSIPIE
jgi:HSP20 family protein